MSFAHDVKRVFRKNKYTQPQEQDLTPHLTDNADAKARHVLGLDTSCGGPVRRNSASSTSTTKLRSVTFSDATTAALSAAASSETSKSTHLQPELHRKTSAVLVKRSRRREQGSSITPQPSNSSLRSFYDRSRTPLSVSQQTSDSSSRDFALRRGAPSVISASSQEMEHYRQLKFFSRLQKKPSYDKSRLVPTSVRPSTNSSQHSMISSIFEAQSDVGSTPVVSSAPSRIAPSRRHWRKHDDLAQQPANHTETSRPYSIAKRDVNPACAKVNVRRPKAGAKNWFDSIESDSSDGELELVEPQFKTEFAVEVKTAFDENRISVCPPRSSSRTSTVGKPSKETLRGSMIRSSVLNAGLKVQTSASHPAPRRAARKQNPWRGADLLSQSVLSLTSSDEDSDEAPTPASYQELARREIRASLMSAPFDDSDVELGQALAVNTKESERLLRQLRRDTLDRPSVPRRVSSRLMTYLDDHSTETLTQRGDPLTSFPRAPGEANGRTASARESVLSENESIVSTKLMTVTRQEESLIAAMRLKKTAMKRAQAAAHRQSTLKMLELDARGTTQAHAVANRQSDHVPAQLEPSSSLKAASSASSRMPKNAPQRHDSVTTFQSDSIPAHSMRNSMASCASEGSEDLQALYSSTYDLPAGSSNTLYPSAIRERSARETFLSERTLTPTTESAPMSDWSPNGRGSHVVVLDPLERQLLRNEIPSQLFMERPFLGWEAQANMQTARG